MVPESVSANTFHSAAGPVLGWQAVKSTLFDIERTAGGYRLTCRGHGHGVGLCVAGAAARAKAGADARAILAAYFPGAELTDAPASAVIRVRLPETERAQALSLRSVVERELTTLSAKLGVGTPPVVDVVFHPTVESYTRTSKLPWWTAARTIGTRIDLAPLAGLKKRGIVESTLRHELVHVLADMHLADRPLWVREGLAVVMAGESTPAASAGPTQCPSDADLRDARSSDAWRRAYETAGRCVARALATGVRWRDLR
jgi:stage II sporulation protein D